MENAFETNLDHISGHPVHLFNNVRQKKKKNYLYFYIKVFFFSFFFKHIRHKLPNY